MTLARLLKPACLAMLMGVTGIAAALAAESQKAIVVHQKSDCYGNVSSTLSEKSLRMTIDGTKSYLVATAPSWRVVFCNPNQNVAMDLTFDEWMAHLPEPTYLPEDGRRSRWKIRATGTIEYLDRTCKKYYAGGSMSKYMLLEHTAAAPQACDIMQKFLYVPKAAGIPMALSFYQAKPGQNKYLTTFAGTTNILSTTKIEEGSRPASIFTYPKIFKKVRREIDVIAADPGAGAAGAIDGFSFSR